MNIQPFLSNKTLKVGHRASLTGGGLNPDRPILVIGGNPGADELILHTEQDLFPEKNSLQVRARPIPVSPAQTHVSLTYWGRRLSPCALYGAPALGGGARHLFSKQRNSAHL